MPLKAVILVRATDAVTGRGWLVTWSLNTWIIKISEPSLITAHNLNFQASHLEHMCAEADSVPVVQETFGGSWAMLLQWRKQNCLSWKFETLGGDT